MTRRLLAFFGLCLAGTVPLPATTADAPPPPAAPRPLRLPASTETTLPNGLRVLVISRTGTGLVSAALLLQNGASTDPDGEAGLASMTAALLTRGTATHTAPEIDALSDTLGARLNANADWDATSVRLSVLRTNVAPAMALMADVVLHPAFAPAELERMRRQRIDGLRVSQNQPGFLAGLIAARALYGTAPYGHALGGTPQSLARITRADIAGMYGTFQPSQATLIVGGDISAKEAFALAGRLFGSWKAEAPSAAAPPVAPAPSHSRIIVVDKPDAGQAAVYVTLPGLRRAAPDYYQGLVSNAVLGTGFSSRLNREIRIKRGLSYGASSQLDARTGVGPFTASAQTKNPSAAEVASLIVKQLESLQSAPPSDAELLTRKATLIGGFDRSLETTDGLVGQIATLTEYGLGVGELAAYATRVNTVGPDDVRQWSETHLESDAAIVVIVGNASLFKDDLRARFPNTPVQTISAAQLNLDADLPAQSAL